MPADDFAVWRDSFESVEIDGARLFLPLGDVLMDEEELRAIWINLRAAPGTTDQTARDAREPDRRAE
jgi:hypothetical protein